MLEFYVADVVTRLLRGVNFVGLPHPTGMQKLRRSAQRRLEGVTDSGILLHPGS